MMTTNDAARSGRGPKANAEHTPEPGETRWSQASGEGLQRPVPEQPNEIDESASSQEAANASMEVVGRAAYHDALTSEDTDRAPVMDAVYNGSVTGGHRTGDGETAHGTRNPSAPLSSKQP